jgi:small basic protein
LKLDFFENLYGRIRNMLSKGYDQNWIVKHFMKSEVKSIKMITLGDVSYENMIRSMLRSMG